MRLHKFRVIIAVDSITRSDNSQYRKSRQSPLAPGARSFLQAEHRQSPVRLQRLDADLRGHVLRDGAERIRLSAVGLADNDRDSQVAAFANVDRDRDRPEERRAVSLSQRLAA